MEGETCNEATTHFFHNRKVMLADEKKTQGPFLKTNDKTSGIRRNFSSGEGHFPNDSASR